MHAWNADTNGEFTVVIEKDHHRGGFIDSIRVNVEDSDTNWSEDRCVHDESWITNMSPPFQ